VKGIILGVIMRLKYNCLDFLDSSDLPWIKYNLAVCNKASINAIMILKKELLTDTRIVTLLDEISKWPQVPLKRHNDAKHIIHKIGLLLELGLTYDDIKIKDTADKILSYQSEEGAFETLLNISKSFGGDGKDSMQWLACDFPILLYILLKLNLENDARVTKAVEFLKSIAFDNGWRCIGSVDKFRGPGRKTDFCPYATLISLKAFSLTDFHDEGFIRAGIDSLLGHWKLQKEKKIYMFGIGTDFRKLKYPNIWYDIINVLDVLSNYEYAVKSEQFSEMIDIVCNKQQENGGFIPESVYMAYKGWDFGQKKEESETLTYIIWNMFNKINRYG
jgi:hypothetical protein